MLSDPGSESIHTPVSCSFTFLDDGWTKEVSHSGFRGPGMDLLCGRDTDVPLRLATTETTW